LFNINTNTVVVNSSILVGYVNVNTNYISVGNSSVNVQITTPTAAQISNGQYFLSANSTWSVLATPVLPVTNGTITTSGLTTFIVDYWLISQYKAAEYLISVTDNNANNHYASKITSTHDGYSAYSTEYSQLVTNTAVGVFYVDSNSSCVRLNFTPVSSNTSVRFIRNII
jgi:hypothetical protein